MNEANLVPSPPSQLARFETHGAVAPIPLGEHLAVVRHHRALVLAVAVTVAAGGLVYAYAKAPVYEGNVLLAVSEVRAADRRNILGTQTLTAGRKTAMSETEMLQSRVILGPVVERLGLDVRAEPKTLPVIGRAIAQWNAGRISWLPAVAGYTWGGAAIDVAAFHVPASLLGERFVLTKLSDTRYRLEHSDSGFAAAGEVGAELQARVGGAGIRLMLEGMTGKTGAQFHLQRISRVEAMETLRTALSVSELGVGSGILRVGLSDKDPQKIRSVLNEVGSTYMAFLRKQQDEQAGAALALLQSQLPGLRERVALAERRVEEFRRAHGTADLAEETKLKLGRHSDNAALLAELRQKRAELGTRLGDEHPQLLALDQQMRLAEQEGSAVSSELRDYPSVARELESRSRSLQAETEIHDAVLRKMEEMAVVAQDRSTAVRIVDEAVAPAGPGGSRSTVVASFAGIGLFLGVFSAFLRRMLSSHGTASDVI